MRRVMFAIGALCAFTAVGAAQRSTSSPEPRFEVASVKKQIYPQPAGYQPPPERPTVFYRRNASVAQLIRFAFDLHATQLVGGPDWIRNDGFEVNAKPAGPASEQTMRLMVQSLLEERFELMFHIEERDMRFSVLGLARNDGRLGPHLERCDPEDPPPPRGFPIPRGGRVAVQRCGPVSNLVASVAGILGTPVVDKTGLQGDWAYDVSYELPGASARLEPASVEAVPLPIALQEQLGLKLESTRGPVNVLIVDSIQQPTEN
jgi:uncharacterized protein (TIGR03435 family)